MNQSAISATSKHDFSPNRKDLPVLELQTSSSVMIHTSATRINQKDFPLQDTGRNQETQENNITLMDKSSIFLQGGDTSRHFLTKRGNEKSHHLRASIVEDELTQITSIERFHSKGVQMMENSQVQSIYDNFTNGATLVFYPQSAYYTTGNKINLFNMAKEHHANQVESITYNVKVINSIHGKEVLKHVMLEKVAHGNPENKAQSTDHDEEDNTSPSLKYSDHGRRKETFFSPNFCPQPSPEMIEPEPFFLNTPTPAKIKLDLSYTNNDGSIFDEIQSNDARARKAVFRNIMTMQEENYAQSPRKKPKTIYTFHESMSFNQAADEVLEISFHGNQTHRLNTMGAMENKKSEDTQNNHKITAQEEDKLLNTKLKKFKQRLEEAVMNVHRAESVTSTYLSKGKKVQQLVTQALRIEPRKRSALIYTHIFVIFVVSMIILLMTQNENLHRGIKAIQREVPVISRAFLRQNAMISSATGVRAWRGALQGDYTTGNWLADNYQWQRYLAYYTDNMTQYNTEMYELLNKLPEEIQSRLYEKNVGIYEYNDDGTQKKTLVAQDSTFAAFQMMIEKEVRCLNMHVPLSFTPDIDTSNFKFILDNILNDLLIQSQSQINHLTEDLNDLTNSTKTKMGLTLGGVVAICIIFAAVSIRYLLLLASEAKIFMITIFRIKSQDGQAVQVILQRFRSALETDMKDLELPNEEVAKQNQNTNNDSVKFRKASMDTLYKSQKIAFMKLFPNSTLFICWGIVYFFLTSDFIGDIQDSEKQMETALQALNNQSLFVTEMIGLILTNITVNIKNKPALPDFVKNLNNLQQTTLLVDNLRDKNGDLTALQEKVLFDFPCEEFLTFYNGDYAYAYQYCLDFGKGKTSIGLVNVNSQLYSIGLNALELYNSSGKTKPELAYIFLLGLSQSTSPINCAEGFLNILYRSTLDNFEKQVNSIELRTMVFTVLIFVFALIGTTTTWHFIMKKIFKAQKIDWYILQIIPIKLILGNKHIQQYLLKHSDGMLDGVKSFL